MAQFNEAFKISMQNAGGYVNDPDDPGKETYRDISRKYNPQWAGWQRIDQMKKQGVKFKTNDVYPDLDILAADFYKKNFWDKVKLDEVKSQPIANQLFDQLLDGIGRTVQMIKITINEIGLASLAVNSVVDGALIALINKANENTFFNKFKALRTKRFQYAGGLLSTSDKYFSFFSKFGPPPSSGPKYVKGWLNRVNKYVFGSGAAGAGLGVLVLIGITIYFLSK